MKRIIRKILIVILVLIFIPVVKAEPLEKPNGDFSNSKANISYKGATTINSNTNEANKSYLSSIGGENALLLKGGESVLENITVDKSGDESTENSDFYGTNAGILVHNNASLTINNGTISTNGSHANGVFAYGTGKIILNNLEINTSKNNSGGIMVTGGGTLTANNCIVKTLGNSSASIRSDRGGGTLTVLNGEFETNGIGSPVIYSTATINVSNANLTSTKSEGIVVEGKNSVTINNVNLTNTNNTLNGNSETYKNIFLYQSMSGDSEVGNSSFTAKNSNIITNNGDTFFVTNTTATINLENNSFTNANGDFLRIQTSKWGKSGSNGGIVTMNLTNQKVKGDIIVDSISELNLSLDNKSVLIGSIDNLNQAKKINLTLSSDSILSLTKDTYIDILTNSNTNNSNIYSNGYKLFVNNQEVSISEAIYEENTETKNESKTDKTTSYDFFNDLYMPILIIGIGVVLLIISFIVKSNMNKKLQNY